MGALQLDCYLSENQMEQILNKVEQHIIKNSDYLDDADFDIQAGESNVYVSFTTFLNRIDIEQDKNCQNELNAEIWMDGITLIYDTTVFQQRLNKLLDILNSQSEESYAQALEIANDQKMVIMNTKITIDSYIDTAILNEAVTKIMTLHNLGILEKAKPIQVCGVTIYADISYEGNDSYRVRDISIIDGCENERASMILKMLLEDKLLQSHKEVIA